MISGLLRSSQGRSTRIVIEEEKLRRTKQNPEKTTKTIHG